MLGVYTHPYNGGGGILLLTIPINFTEILALLCFRSKTATNGCLQNGKLED